VFFRAISVGSLQNKKIQNCRGSAGFGYMTFEGRAFRKEKEGAVVE
jgi:hypothetical protein